jgi:hypothetical protein
MTRWAKAIFGSCGSWVAGGVVGPFTAICYERLMYPPEPDPIHFDVGGVFLGVWAAVWLMGTIGSAWWVFRSGSSTHRE